MSNFAIATEVEDALRARFAQNGDITTFAAVGTMTELAQEEIFPPAVIVESSAFTNDGGGVGWPLYVGSMFIHVVTTKVDDATSELCEKITQFVLDTMNDAGFKSAMNNDLEDKSITYIGSTCDSGVDEEIDPEALNEIGYTLTVRVQQ